MCANNDTIVNDLSTLTHDDLIDSYEKLAESYRQVKSEVDQQKQQIHSQIREIRALSMTQNDYFELQAEIENMNERQRKQAEDSTSVQNDELKRRLNELEFDMAQLQEKYDVLASETKEKDSVIESLREEVKLKSKPRQSFSHEYQMEIERLSRELTETSSQLKSFQREVEQKNHRIEIMLEELECQRGNLESNKSKIEEMDDQIKNLQEMNMELTMELSSLRTAPAADDKSKGNSLFAEVDDQRKQMKEVLAREHSSQAEMKKKLNYKDVEIRRLKRENQNIKNDIQECSTLLARAEKVHDEIHKAQVDRLEKEVKKLEDELRTAQERLIDLAKNHKLGWIDSIVTMSEENQRESRQQLMRALMDNSQLSDNLLKVQCDFSKAQLIKVQLRTMLMRIVERKSIKIVESDYHGVGIDSELFQSLKLDEIDNNEENLSFNSTDFTFEGDTAMNSTAKCEILDKSLSPKQPLKSSENLMKPPPPPLDTSEEVNSSEVIKAQPISSLKRVPVVVKRIVIPSKKK